MAKNVREILDILEPHWNYKDYTFLEKILKEFGTSELQKEMKEYIADMEEFEKRTSVKDYNSAALNEIPISTHFEELPLEYSKDPTQCLLYVIRQFVNRIVNWSTLTGYSVLVKSLSCNSIKILLAFPPEAYAELSSFGWTVYEKTPIAGEATPTTGWPHPTLHCNFFLSLVG